MQAAFHDPELLVLDEPTAGLDPLMQERFVHFVSEERARGHTVLLSSHDLDEVQRTCDRVGMIRDGRLVAVDDVQELTRRSFRHVAIEFAEPPDARELRGLPGVVDFSQHGRRDVQDDRRDRCRGQGSGAPHGHGSRARAPYAR